MPWPVLRRRRFVLGAMGLGTLAAAAAVGVRSDRLPGLQRTRRIGWFSPSADGPVSVAIRAAFLDQLRGYGWIEGQNLTMGIWRADGDPERLPALAADIASQVELIVSTGGPATALAAKAATRTVPIVTTGTNDPVRIGLIESLARPGGNVTGVSSLGETLSTKWLELLREVTPDMHRVSTLWNPDNPGSVVAWEGIQLAARADDVELQSIPARLPADIEPALAEVAAWQPDALVPTAVEPMSAARMRIAAFALRQRLPTITLNREYVEVGCLMSYGANPVESTRRGAYYVDKILRGASPAELPVEQPSAYELAVNTTTAQALDITLSPTLASQVSTWLA